MADKDDDTEENEGAEGAVEGAPAEGGGFDARKIILFVVAPLVLLGGTGAGLYFTGMLDGLLGKGEEHAEEGAGEAGGHGAKKADSGGHGKSSGGHGGGEASAFLAIPPMIVNLNSEDGTPRYLRLSVQLEMNDPADVASVEAVLPRVVDQFQTYLRELRVKDLRGSAGIYRLQMELLWRVNQAAAPIEVKDVLFQEILIQ